MQNSDYIHSRLKRIEKFYEDLIFHSDDIRRNFYGMVQNSVQTFYGGHISNELSQLIKNGQVIFTEDTFDKSKHINCLIKIYGDPNNSINSLNSTLVISCWGSFEVSLTTLSEALLPQKTKDELNSLEFEKALKILKDENIKEETIEKLKSSLAKNHLTHVPVWRKFNCLVKHPESLGKKYSRKRKEDVEFISRYCDMRNSLMHSNGVYYGENKLYSFQDYQIKFENGKQFTYSPDKELPEFYIDLVSNLSNIFTALTELYSETDFISYPDTETP